MEGSWRLRRALDPDFKHRVIILGPEGATDDEAIAWLLEALSDLP